MLEHPWMVFVIILLVIEAIGYIVKYITGYKDDKTDENDDDE